MKPSDIKVGNVYCNAGEGRTRRRVIRMDWENGMCWVTFTYLDGNNAGASRTIRRTTFARWAGSEVTDA